MCNCNNNPCSCANANCACPPDYTFQPATLSCQGTTCEDTLQTQCIFLSSYLACSKVPIGATLDTVLQAMDTKICQCGSCSGNTFVSLPLFYVDSENTVNGDGSVGNPFKTLDLAYTAVIGTGSINAPQFTNANIFVMGGTYTTAINSYASGINWTYFNYATVTFTGTGYFIDSAAATDGANPFNVFGYINFKTSTGGFLRNSASYTASNINKAVYVEAYQILGNTSIGNTPLINHVMSYGGSGYGRPSTLIKMQGQSSVISSATQTTIFHNGSTLQIDLGGGYIFYGVDSVSGTVPAGSNSIVTYNCTDSINPGSSKFYLRNGFIASAGAGTDMISMQGYYNFFRVENITTVNIGNTTKPATFLNVNTTNSNLSDPNSNFSFLLTGLFLSTTAFNSSTVIKYTGGGNTFNNLQMQNCTLYEGCTIDYAHFVLGSNAEGGSTTCYNIINGLMSIVGLPTSTAGLNTGNVYNSSGTLKIF